MRLLSRIKNRIKRAIYVKNLKDRVGGVQKKRKYLIKCGNDYGGFVVDKQILDLISSNNRLIVYSFGIGADLSFSKAISERWDCDIFAFDPTPEAIEYVHQDQIYNSAHFHFYPVGLATKDGNMQFNVPVIEQYVQGLTIKKNSIKEVSGSLSYYGENTKKISVECKTLSSLMKENGHSSIDLLKMDIEGTEFDVVEDIILQGVDFKMLCVETHDRMIQDGVERLEKMIKSLNDASYYIVSISSDYQEYTFVRNDLLTAEMIV